MGVESTKCAEDNQYTGTTRSIVKVYPYSDRNGNDRTFSTRRMKYPGLMIHRQRDIAG